MPIKKKEVNERLAEHKKRILNIQERFLKKLSTQANPFCLESRLSTTLRSNGYKDKKSILDISSLNHVVHIDPDRKIALVEPRVTMDQLVRETLVYGLIPAIVPELKMITVGGAINGAAGESSSHRHALFNDICLSYEILSADGSLIKASSQEHRDLFYGIAGSYGTLGYILSAEIQLVPCKGWVLLNLDSFDGVAKAINHLKHLYRVKDAPEYIEGIVFSQDNIVIISGSQIEEKHLSLNVKKVTLKHSFSHWFYQTIKDNTAKKYKQIAMPIYDYLFRYNLGGFWMGSYITNKRSIFTYLLCKLGSSIGWMYKNTVFQFRYPSFFFRLLSGWIMHTKAFLHLWHRSEHVFADIFVIQDYGTPEDKTVDFIEYVLNKYKIVPLWLCPIKPVTTPQIFSPHYIDAPFIINVGIYGYSAKHSGSAISRDLDHNIITVGGRKVFYSHSYYSPEEFWQIYNRKEYEQLREKYFASKRLMDITDKVLDKIKY